MKILFLCTAHNSLSQRLYLELSSLGHDISIEFALSNETMHDAVELFKPELVICPFLTTRVPKAVYSRVLTLIVHPGPPGDAGPSALDWLLIGDDGSTLESDRALSELNTATIRPGRSHWAVTIIQAIEDYDAGPIWAFQQFPVDIDQRGLTKSEIYRGAVTRAAVVATKAAILRIENATEGRRHSSLVSESAKYLPILRVDEAYGQLSVLENIPFQGGKTRHRPLLKAVERDFDLTWHTAQQISRRIRSADSQPGVLSRVFGLSLFVYGGIIEDQIDSMHSAKVSGASTHIVGVHHQSVCVATCDGKGIWITHVRRPKGLGSALQPKVPATFGLLELGVLSATDLRSFLSLESRTWSFSSVRALQDIWINILVDDNQKRIAYLYWEFYNGAMGCAQCSRLIEAMEFVLTQSTSDRPIHAVVLMGGSYFCNGIALNVAEAATDPAAESWLNINLIDDVVYYILQEFPKRDILTIAAMRGNAAAGGVALATACDFAMAGSDVVLNPAYRAIGLSGSEYHTLSYHQRCGKVVAEKILRSMQPMSPYQAQRIGLIDYVFPAHGVQLDRYIRSHVSLLLQPGCLKRGFWKAQVDTSPVALARIRAYELGEMSKDFWSPRSARYHSRRFDFIRKTKPTRTPLRFAKHRRLGGLIQQDEEEMDLFDDLEYFKKSATDTLISELRNKILMEINVPEPLSNVLPTLPESIELVAASTNADSNDRPLFSCYYHSEPNEPLTPPETPFEFRNTEAFFDSFGCSAANTKSQDSVSFSVQNGRGTGVERLVTSL